MLHSSVIALLQYLQLSCEDNVSIGNPSALAFPSLPFAIHKMFASIDKHNIGNAF